MAKSALQKLQSPAHSKIVPLPASMPNWGPADAPMLISTPLEIEAAVQKIPRGKLATTNSLRQHLATQHEVILTCPITTGIFMNVVAKAAEERRALDGDPKTAWWRVLKSDGSLNQKFPGGIAAQESYLRDEGHVIVTKGRSKRMVQDFESKLNAF